MCPLLKVLLFVIFIINVSGGQIPAPRFYIHSFGYYGNSSLSRLRHSPSLEVVTEWNQLNFGFPTETDRETAIANGNFIIENTIPIDVAAHYQDNEKLRLFTTIPRFSAGVPYSLATFSGSRNPELQAYPSYRWHSTHGADCDGITSAFRIAITPCNQMWVIDSGKIGSSQLCAPQLLRFDLNTDRLVQRYRFSENVYTPRSSLFITPVVSVNDPAPNGNCDNTTVYIADVNTFGLIVYDQLQNAAWRIDHRFMYPDPDEGRHTIADESFTLMDGIFGLNVVGNDLYFHPLASKNEYKVSLNILADRAAFDFNTGAHEESFKEIGQRNSPCAATASDNRGNIYCVTFNPIRLIRWNVATPYKSKNLLEISDNEDLLQFASGMKVVKNLEGKEELWMMTNRFQKFASGTMKTDETNFRVLKLDLDNIADAKRPSSKYDLHDRLTFN